MEEEAAKRLINKTLNKSFNKGQFTYFVKNLFNSIEGPTFTYRGNYIPKAYQEYIKTLSRVGKYTGPDENKVDILVVQLEKETSLERARTMQRNFIAWYLNGSRGDVLKDAALAAFVAPNQEDWRLSLVKMAYDLKQTEEGKVKIKKELTPARRWSFLVGTHENTHTVRKQLLPLLVREDEISLSDFEKAFDIEVVTKRFFKKYRELFYRVQESLDKIVETNEKVSEEFERKNVSTSDFAKKLLGQIVFLYFLQKKGWFGVDRDAQWGTGPKNFLRLLFEKKLADYENFFNDILEPLFYEALAVERPDDYYSRFNCKIPFLNGGLFDPIYNYDWVHTDILLPNELFSNQEKTKEGDIGTGILDVFDRYNFTVKEDEPLEKEVAVDPEMLGKVFENLLEVKDRKSKGTYYTPREIVHYMCQESLVNYLATELDGKVGKEDIRKLIGYGETVVEHERQVENQGEETKTYSYKLPGSIRDNSKLIDKKLAEVKVCDPAVGSGAFPVGMMNEVVRARNALTTYLDDKEERTIYKFKHHAIQNSLYGVDIDPGAVEIAKLRLWLSLVVDEEDRHIIQPLPNLDYKIMQGNSLLEEYEGIKLIDKKFFEKQDSKEEKLSSLKERQSKLQREYIGLHSQDKLDKAKKVELERKLKNLENRIKNLRKEKEDSNSIKSDDLFSGESKARKKAKKLQRKQREFFRAAHKKEKDKLREEIENITWDLIEATLKEQGAEDELEKVEQFKKSNTKPFFLWHLNFSEVFEEKGGFDVVIANPPYVGEKGHKEIFRKIKKGWLGNSYQGKMDIFYFFFHLALNLSHNLSDIAFITTNYYVTATGAAKLRKDFKERAIVQRLVNFSELKLFESALGQHNMVTILQRGQDEQVMAKTAITRRAGTATAEILQKVLSWVDEDTDYFEVAQNKLYEGDENYIRLSGASKLSKILNHIKSQGLLLGSICNVNQGIVTGADKVSRKHIMKYGVKANVGDGIFVLSDKEISNLNLSKKEKEILKPWFKNSDIDRYWVNRRTDEYVLYSDGSYQEKTIPNIIKHLSKFRDNLEQRREVHKGSRNWYDLWWSREQHIFECPKIVAPQRSPRNTFGYNEIPWYASADVYFITEKDKGFSLKYILALLNSRLYYLWLYYRGKRKGETLELYQKPLSEIPIKQVSSNEQKPFIDLVNKILAITKDDDYLENSAKQAKVREYEKQIDQLVYELYGLTPEEIEIVEDSVK